MEAGIGKAFANYLRILEGKQKPRFQIAKEKGDLAKKIKQAEKILQSCELCIRKCHINRIKGELGFCRAGIEWKIFGAHTHMGEETELIPSATIFMAGCTMRCVYCQNAPESVNPEMGEIWTEREGAEWIANKFNEGCKNVNFVGGEPTPYLYNILKCLNLCKANIPVIWNSNSYYSEKTTQILQDIVDIYLLDFRYFNEQCAIKLSSAPNYVATAKKNFLEAKKDAELLVRLLVMPNHIECDAKPILKWIKDNLGAYTRVNIMGQYFPCWQADKFSDINRVLTREEYLSVIDYAKQIGLKNFMIQGHRLGL
jgi:putative pyruvate formate lyase activating enzyme